MAAKTLVLIPARYGSTRFPGKPLALIQGKSMIQRVYENCCHSPFDVYVVTDSPLIEEHVLSFKGNIIRVDDDVSSGSIRVQLAYERHFSQLETPYEYIINVQGDEPLFKGEELKELLEFHKKSNYDATTFVRPRSHDRDDYLDPSVVKAIYNPLNGECHYFSRSPLPYSFDEKGPVKWYQHIGIYCFRPQILKRIVQLPSTYYEETEKLEQLRLLDHSFLIGAVCTEQKLISVDHPTDVTKIEGVLSGLC